MLSWRETTHKAVMGLHRLGHSEMFLYFSIFLSFYKLNFYTSSSRMAGMKGVRSLISVNLDFTFLL